MATVTFASTLNVDGSVTMPKSIVDELGIHPGDEVQVRIDTESNDDEDVSALDRAVARLTNRTPEELAAAQARALELYKPERTPPPGKTIADMVCGKWPGDETDEEIFAALRELS